MYINQQQNYNYKNPIYKITFYNNYNKPHLLTQNKKNKLIQ